MDLVIVGGGIGGLAAALAAVGRVESIVVLERYEEFGEIGAGMQLSPNAFVALAELGVVERVRRASVPVRELLLLDAFTGSSLARLPLDETFEREFGAPYAVVHRGELHRALVDACRAEPSIRLATDAHVVGFSEENDSVETRLADGRAVRSSCLIGADGLRSVIRSQLLGDGAPRLSGHVAYRALVAAEDFPSGLVRDAAVLWAGPAMHVVHYPLVGGSAFNLVATAVAGVAEYFAGRETTRNTVLAQFSGVADELSALLEVPTSWRAWALCDRPPTPRWTSRRVGLLGDAAHPMLQYAAQGACQALEDAVALGAALSEHEPAHALSRYEAVRSGRTARVQQLARWLGETVYHATGPAAIERSVMLDAMTPMALREAARWLYAWDASTQAAASAIGRE